MLCSRNKTQIPRVVQRFAKTLQKCMYVITANKQNRNHKIFSIIVLWKQLLPKQTKTTAQALLSQPDYIIIYLRIILLFWIPITGWLLDCLVKKSKSHQEMTTLNAFVNSCTLKIETATSVIFLFRFWKGSQCYWLKLVVYQILVQLQNI